MPLLSGPASLDHPHPVILGNRSLRLVKDAATACRVSSRVSSVSSRSGKCSCGKNTSESVLNRARLMCAFGLYDWWYFRRRRLRRTQACQSVVLPSSATL